MSEGRKWVVTGSAVAAVLLSAAWFASGKQILLRLALACTVLFFQFALRAAAVFLMDRVWKNGPKLGEKWCFPRKWEPRFYRALHLRKWTKYCSDTGNSCNSECNWTALAQRICRREAAHSLAAPLGFLPLIAAVWLGHASALLSAALIGASADATAILFLRYNRARVLRSAARREPERLAEAGLLTDGEVVLVHRMTIPADTFRGWTETERYDICDLYGSVLGACDLRLGHNRNLYYAGNIGYGVDEPYRGHRYAEKASRLLFRRAKTRGMDRLIITCNPDNLPSRTTCQRLGGRLVEIARLPEDNEMRVKDGETEKCIFEYTL